MTRRAAIAVLGDLAADLSAGTPNPDELRRALCEDVYELLASLELLEAGVAARSDDVATARALTWPGAPVVELSGEPAIAPITVALERLGYDQAVLVAFDAPDLPGLLIGKLFRGLVRAEVAVCPAEAGGLVALAVSLPAPPWLLDSGVNLDTADAQGALRAAAPARRAVHVGPGWHRVRSAADLERLDPGLEGWEATRRARTLR